MINNEKRTRRLRWAAAAAAAALAGISVAACSSASAGAGSGQEPQSITFAYSNPSGNEHYFQDAAAAYEKAHPGVTITLQKLPAESYPQAIATRIEGGNARRLPGRIRLRGDGLYSALLQGRAAAAPHRSRR